MFTFIALLLFPAFGAMSFSSIANPLLNSGDTGYALQLSGDQRNIAPNRVLVNQAGYRLCDVRAGAASFRVIAASGITNAVISGNGTRWTVTLTDLGAVVRSQVNIYASNSAFTVAGGDVRDGYPLNGSQISGNLYRGYLPTGLASGSYRILVGEDTSVSFVVSANLYGMVRDASLLFMGIERSGEGSSWFHGSSHTWDGWLLDSAAKDVGGNYLYKGALSGGWYDAGTHLKESRSQSFAAAMLGIAAATHPSQDLDHYGFDQSATTTDGIPDVLRELKWGCDYALKAWNLSHQPISKGKIYLSVGDFEDDHSYWGLPENQDLLSFPQRGNRTERTLRADSGTPSLSDWAAALAFAARLWKPYDASWSDSALKAAEAFYDTALSRNASAGSITYSGDRGLDDLALAAVALLWATGQKSYLSDLVYTAKMPDGAGGTCAASDTSFYRNRFAGGYFGCGSTGMTRSGNTNWESVDIPAYYAFHKLILRDSTAASAVGISETERRSLEEKTILAVVTDLSALSGSGTSVSLPSIDLFSPNILAVDSLWGTLLPSSFMSNEGRVGNSFDLYAYWDMTGDILSTGTKLPHITSPLWNRDAVLKELLDNVGYILGQNPFDICWMIGVGAKNPMHPHLRSANPEGKNIPESPYPYRIPVGALYGGQEPSSTNTFTDRWSDYYVTEPMLTRNALFVLLSSGLAEDTAKDTLSGETGILTAGRHKLELPLVRRTAGGYLLTRSSTDEVRLQIIDLRGAFLDNQKWTTNSLLLPHTTGMHLLRLTSPSGVARTIVLPPI